MTNTDQFDEIEIKDDSTPVRHLNAQYRIPEPRKAGISVSPIRHPEVNHKKNCLSILEELKNEVRLSWC